MMRIFYIVFLVIGVLLASCAKDSRSSEKVMEISAIPNAAEIIRNPVSAEGIQDTTSLPKMKFENRNFDFGTVNEGDMVMHTYSFENIGKGLLLITDVRSNCGCTVPKWPEEAIQPGGRGEISVKFDTKGKPNRQSKPITITSNTFPSKTVLRLEGFVNPKK